MVDWKKHRKALTRAFSWISGGLSGGIAFALIQSSIEPDEPAFWVFLLIILVIALILAYGVVAVEPEGNEGELKEINEKLENITTYASKTGNNISGSEKYGEKSGSTETEELADSES